MFVYFLNIAFLFFWAAIFLNKKNQLADQLNNKAIYCTLATTQWIILSGLRHVSVGADTVAYKYAFERVIVTPWSIIWSDFFRIFEGNTDLKAPGYALFQKIVQVFTNDYQVYLVFIALAFTIPLGLFIYKYSKEPCLSFLIYSCLFYSFFAITGHRQTIATALVVLIGFKCIRGRKLIPFIILTVLAYTIHKSALVFFPFYFIAPIRITAKKLVIYVIVSILFFVFFQTIYAAVAKYLGYERAMETDIPVSGRFVVMMVAIGFMVLFRGKDILLNNPEFSFFAYALTLAIIFSVLTTFNQAFMRIQQYYSLSIMICIPEIVYSFKTAKEKMLVYAVACSALLLLYTNSVQTYLFFWQVS